MVDCSCVSQMLCSQVVGLLLSVDAVTECQHGPVHSLHELSLAEIGIQQIIK